MNDCLFCEIIADPEHSNVEGYEEVLGVASFTARNPAAPGHLLFVPTAHIIDAGEDPEQAGEVFRRAAEWAQSQAVPFNLITSAGREAAQAVFHLSIHYIPRAVDDGLTMPWGRND
jgi:histidine triad (HIT) family protein